MQKDEQKKNRKGILKNREIAVLKEQFPSCFHSDGSFDMDHFAEILGKKINISYEGYELRFLGKNYAKMLATIDTETVMVPDEEHNALPENCGSRNLYITGDNLDGLKHLLKEYAGEVGCIYIDPPYNTGSDGFVYNDRFTFTIEELAEKLHVSEEQAARIAELTEKGSASHSAWLTFMYPRLILARELLREDGVIFISIDDHEYANLKLICDDIFGEDNYLNTLAWVSNITGRQISDSGAAKTWESILVYGKTGKAPGLFTDFRFARSRMKDSYKGFRKDIREDAYGEFAVGDTLYNHNRKFNEETRPNLVFSIYYDPQTEEITTGEIGEKREGLIELPPHPNRDGIHQYHAWRWSREKIARESYNLIVLPTSRGGYEIYTRIRDFHKTALKDIITNISNGDKEVKALFGGKGVFEYPKSVDLVKLLVKSVGDTDCLVLDFFSGSATTAHAVMEANAEDRGNRRFLLIQIPEEVKPGSVAAKEGYHTIDEMGRERIRRAAAEIRETLQKTEGGREQGPKWEPDLGFCHMTLENLPRH